MMKKLFLTLVLCVCGWMLQAQDLSAGYPFADGQRVTAAQLQQLVTLAQIQPAFYTRQVAQGVPLSGDLFLCYSAASGTLHKLSASSLIYTNYGLFTSQTTYTNVAPYDTFLFYDPSNVLYGQIPSTNLANVLLSYVQPSLATALYASNYTYLVNKQIFTPNIYYGTNYFTNYWHQTNVFAVTNLTMFGTNSVTTLTNNDTVPFFSTLQNTNTTMTLAALTQFEATQLQPQGTNKINATLTNGVNTNLDYTTYFTVTSETNTFSSNAVPTLAPNWFTTSELGLANSSYQSVTNFALNGTIPRFTRWVLVCKTADLGYVAGQEVEVMNTWESSTGRSHFSTGTSTNAVWVQVSNANTLQFLNTSGAATSIASTNNWRLKCYYAK